MHPNCWTKNLTIGVFCMTKYDYELKKRVVTAYLNGEGGYKFISKKYDISDKLHVKNKSQIMTWLRWYKNGETHRFNQPVGKQYTYGKGVLEEYEIERLRMENKQLKARIDIMGKYQEIERMLMQK